MGRLRGKGAGFFGDRCLRGQRVSDPRWQDLEGLEDASRGLSGRGEG